MLVLFETPAGYAIFKLLDEKKLEKSDNLYLDFDSPESASKVVKLKHFQKFEDTTEALAAATAAVEGKMSKSLKKILKKVVAAEAHEKLAVADAKLGGVIKDKIDLNCVASSNVSELMRCIRSQLDSLVGTLPQKEIAAMSLGLAHSLSRYKLKFSPDKVDTMIVQAVSLLDDLDKELNNYVMRAKEWYGWHFPELSKILTDNLLYIRTVKHMGMRINAAGCDLSDILPEDLEEQVKEAAEISMGTEISDLDMFNINDLCQQVIEITEYRAQLYDYLKNRMMAIAPNLTTLVGELIGARLIAHAGSLVNLAKHPASTVQILGAEKALFRALKTRADTPKYGLLYHAQLITSTNAKIKGKVSRMLATKAALASRVDALGEENTCDMGIEHRERLEARIRALETGEVHKISGLGKHTAKFQKHKMEEPKQEYAAATDSTIPKRKAEPDSDSEEETKSPKKKLKVEAQVKDETPKKKKKKEKKESESTESTGDASGIEATTPGTSEKKKKKKKVKQEAEEAAVSSPEPPVTSEKKKKKKKKCVDAEASQMDVSLGASPEKKKKKKKQVKEEGSSDSE